MALFKTDKFNLLSIIIIAFTALLSLIRLWQAPQFVDGYYHLATANGFINSGGWVGWAWWDFSPLGRPQLYPPLYHFLLIFLIKLGVKGILAVKITEILITPLFFYCLWYSFKVLVNNRFSFWLLLILWGFFPFYISVSSNIPASLALIFGFLSWIFFKKDKITLATLLLILSLYTHAVISWLFVISYIFVMIYLPIYRKIVLRILLISLTIFLPFLYHQFSYRSYINIPFLLESQLTAYNIFIIIMGMISLVIFSKKIELPIVLMWGVALSAMLLFIRYPYRLFSAQGIIGLAFFSALLIEHIVSKVKGWKSKIIFMILFFYLLCMQTVFFVNKREIKIDLFSSTFTNFMFGKTQSNLYFSSLYYNRFFDPIIKVINDNSLANDIIVSNVSIVSEVFSAVTQRPIANSILKEIKPAYEFTPYHYAKIIIWIKSLDDKYPLEDFKAQGLDLKKSYKIYENEMAYVFLNKEYKAPESFMAKAKISFNMIILISIILIGGGLILNKYEKNYRRNNLCS